MDADPRINLKATDIRDIADINQGIDSDWYDVFSNNLEKALTKSAEEIKAMQLRKRHSDIKQQTKLWSVGEIKNQLWNFIRGKSPVESSNDRMSELDAGWADQYKGNDRETPQRIYEGDLTSAIRNMRQHTTGVGGKA